MKRKPELFTILYTALYVLSGLALLASLVWDQTLLGTVMTYVGCLALDAGVVLQLIKKIRKKEPLVRWAIAMGLLAVAMTLIMLGMAFGWFRPEMA